MPTSKVRTPILPDTRKRIEEYFPFILDDAQRVTNNQTGSRKVAWQDLAQQTSLRLLQSGMRGETAADRETYIKRAVINTFRTLRQKRRIVSRKIASRAVPLKRVRNISTDGGFQQLEDHEWASQMRERLSGEEQATFDGFMKEGNFAEVGFSRKGENPESSTERMRRARAVEKLIDKLARWSRAPTPSKITIHRRGYQRTRKR